MTIIRELFLTFWDAAVGTSGYRKADWRELGTRLWRDGMIEDFPMVDRQRTPRVMKLPSYPEYPSPYPYVTLFRQGQQGYAIAVIIAHAIALPIVFNITDKVNTLLEGRKYVDCLYDKLKVLSAQLHMLRGERKLLAP